MLSKEEISKLKINVFNQCDDETIRLVAEMLKHTEQLESREQKLIEKLEEESKQLEHDILTMSIDTGNKYSLKLIHQAEGMKKQNDRILEILKKE